MRLRVSLLLIIVVSFVAPALAQKRSITEKDLFNFVWIGDPQVSPDGSRVLFGSTTASGPQLQVFQRPAAGGKPEEPGTSPNRGRMRFRLRRWDRGSSSQSPSRSWTSSPP